MKLIKQKVELLSQNYELPQSELLNNIYKQIEIAGRTCYKSEANITDTSAKDFVDRMISSGHGAMLEHGTVYLYFGHDSALNGYKYRDNKYSKYVEIREREQPIPVIHKYITTYGKRIILSLFNLIKI